MVEVNNRRISFKDVVFQFILHFMNPYNPGDLITRVVTQRLEVVNDHNDHDRDQFYQSLHKDALPILLAKEAAYRCMVHDNGDSEIEVAYNHEEIEDLVLKTQVDLDTTAHKIHACHEQMR